MTSNYVTRPILMSAPMVRALLDGRKTQTRRLAERFVPAKRPPRGMEGKVGNYVPTIWQSVKPGDRLWVRETWMPHSIYNDMPPAAIPNSKVFYHADDTYAPSNTRWRPSIHMPRRFSRLTLIVTATKMERVQEISTPDCWAEGIDADQDADRCPVCNYTTRDAAELMDHQHCEGPGPRSPLLLYADVWQSLHTKPGARWEDNPEVVALTFTVHQRNIDAMGEAA